MRLSDTGLEGDGLLASEIEVAPRVDADLPVLFGLAMAAFGGLPGWSDERVLEVLNSDVIFVAREDDQPAGYVALHRDEDGMMVVEQLFVGTGHERRGIGRRLLAYAEGYAIAERAPSLQVVVEESNRPARSFYKRSGFVPVEPELFELVLPRE
jgi:ribosomal protein S18 acetylase RimI-like enzyme